MGGFRAFWFNVIKDDKVLEGNDLIRHYNDELLKATKGKIHLDKKWLE
jgi:hypothetical protein